MRILSSAWLAVLFMASMPASPLLPESALGVAKTVHITNDRLVLVLNGGRYTGLINGVDADLWCVDVERFASKGQTYAANVVPLLPWTPDQAALVRKGTFSNSDFWWDVGLGSVERYQAAAWLITQMEAYRTGSSVLSDLHIQQAIWGILDDAESQSIDLTPLARDWMHTAVAFLRDNPDFGLGQWAVVSGNVAPDGAFQGWEYQSFLVRLASVAPQARLGGALEEPEATHAPEPSPFAMIGAGLLFLGWTARRRPRR